MILSRRSLFRGLAALGASSASAPLLKLLRPEKVVTPLIVGDGTGATATCTVVAGMITAITILNAGSGYTTVPTIVFT